MLEDVEESPPEPPEPPEPSDEEEEDDDLSDLAESPFEDEESLDDVLAAVDLLEPRLSVR